MENIYLVIGIAFGVFAIHRRIIQLYRTIIFRYKNQDQHKQVTNVGFSMFGFGLIYLLALYILIKNFNNIQYQIILPIVMLISIGEMINSYLLNSYRFNDKNILYFDEVIEYNGIRKINSIDNSKNFVLLMNDNRKLIINNQMKEIIFNKRKDL